MNNIFLLLQCILQILAGVYFFFKGAILLGILQFIYASGNVVLMFLKLQ